MNNSDVASEKAVLAGIFQYGSNAYVDVADIVNLKTFTSESNQLLFKCFEYALKDKVDATIDLATIFSSAAALGLNHILENDAERKHIRAVMNFPINQANVRTMAKRIRKLQIARDASYVVDDIKSNLIDVTGDEPVDQILGMIEGPVYDYVLGLSDAKGDGPQKMSEGIDKYLDYLIANPVENVGISSGYPLYDMAIGGGFRRKTVNMIGARPKVGKAQPLTSIIHTENGPKLMKDINIGDKVCNANGDLSTVLSIHPQGKIDFYEVSFDDGDKMECSYEHLFEVYHTRTKKTQVLSLKEIINSGLYYAEERLKWRIKLPKPAMYKKNALPVSPYLLGLLLGDGCFRHGITYTTIDEELVDYMKLEVVKYGYLLKQISNSISYRITNGKNGGEANTFTDLIKNLGLYDLKSHDKFIPEIYKLSDANDRLEILCGLLDTDGTVDTRGNIQYSTTSNLLAQDVKFIVDSLGGLSKIRARTTKCNGKSFNSYILHIRLPNIQPFKLNRKLQRLKNRTKDDLSRAIKNIEFKGQVDCQCIKLDSNDGLYLTDNFIVTHNTLLADNIAMHVAGIQKIPVLNLDTEMSKEDHWNRMLANISGVPIKEIETGKFASDAKKKEAVLKAGAYLKQMPYEYISIAGMAFEEIVSIMRRWIMKSVGLEESGQAKPCLIIYDYLKLMDSGAMGKNMQEFQVLGFQMTGLHNFMVRYGAACLSFIQLNRDGITKEDTDAASGSDRIIWLCSNFTIYKPKTDEEIAEEAGLTKERYNRKLVPIIARHGAGMDSGDYINMKMTGNIGKIEEGKTRNDIYGQTPHSGATVTNHKDKESNGSIQYTGDEAPVF